MFFSLHHLSVHPAVRRSREKSKVKYDEKEQQIMRLREEHKYLQDLVAKLTNDLAIYEDLVISMGIPLTETMPVYNGSQVKFENDHTFY